MTNSTTTSTDSRSQREKAVLGQLCVELMLDRSDTATVAAVTSASLTEFRNEPWYLKLPLIALEHWESFSVEARAAMLVMAHRLVYANR